MLKNIIIITVIIAVCIALFLYYKKKLEEFSGELETSDVTSLKEIIDKVRNAFAEQQETNLMEMNLSAAEYKALDKSRKKTAKLLRESSKGDINAKRYIVDSIKEILTGSAEIGISPESIDSVIPFNNPDKLSLREKTAIVYHIYYKYYQENGFKEFMYDYGFERPKPISLEDEENGELRYEVTEEMFNIAFADIYTKTTLEYDDKLDILAKEIFARYKGFGAIDSLVEFSLDEIDCGVNGIQQGKYQLKGELDGIEYAHTSIFVTFSGLNIKLSYMSFENNAELQRVCSNIYKFETPYILSRRKGKVVGTMKDGSRIAVSMPPTSSSYAFWLRKFDSAPSVSPQKLLRKRNADGTGYVEEKGAEYIIILSRWILRTRRSMMITGGMGTGKTTWLKAIIRFIPSLMNIRVYEISPELNLQFTYPKRNIKDFAVSESVSMHELYDFGKKANANINIVGESASAEMGVIFFESCTVGSEMALGTHHAKTAPDLVIALRDNLLMAGGYNDVNVAEKAVANALNFNTHMAREKGHRYIERITEIIPIRDREYPFEKSGDISEFDRVEYYKRVTDRQNFECKNIIEYRHGEYVVTNRISDQMLKIMRDYLPEDEQEEFTKDMEMLFSQIGDEK